MAEAVAGPRWLGAAACMAVAAALPGVASAGYVYLGGPDGVTDVAVWSNIPCFTALEVRVGPMGDLDCDVVADFAVGDQRNHNRSVNRGRVWVVYGQAGQAPGPQTWWTPMPCNGSYAGRGLTCGDFDGDGCSDVVTAYRGIGEIRVWDATPVWVIEGGTADEYFGELVGGAGDLVGHGGLGG